MNIMQYNGRQVLVEFRLVDGDHLFFMKHYKQLVHGTKTVKDDGTIEQVAGVLTPFDDSDQNTF